MITYSYEDDGFIEEAVNNQKSYIAELVAAGERESIGCLKAKYSLAALFVRTQQYEQAKPILEDVLHGRRAHLGEKNFALISVLWNLAKCAYHEKSYQEMFSYLKEGYALQHQKNPNCSSHATFLFTTTLCERYIEQGNKKEAQQFFDLLFTETFTYSEKQQEEIESLRQSLYPKDTGV